MINETLGVCARIFRYFKDWKKKAAHLELFLKLNVTVKSGTLG